MEKILIFGATGNTGAYVLDYCLEYLSTKYEIIAIGRRSTSYYKNKGIPYYRVDITKKEDFCRLPKENVYAVIFLSGILPAYMEGYHPEQYIMVNSLGALNILEYCKCCNVEKIIYAQTISDILGNIKNNPHISPYMSRNIIMKGDHTVYALSKCFAVDLIEHYKQEYGLKTYIFRLPTIYEYTPNEFYYVNGQKKMLGYRKIMNQAMHGEDIEMWGNPDRSKDVVYILDFCQLVYKAIIATNKGGWYNVGTGTAISLKEQIEGIIDVFCPKEKKSKIILRPDMPDAPAYVMDIDNAKKELGYEPKYRYMDFLYEFKKEMKLNRYRDLRKEDY